jgi:hypothetical protein
MGLKPFPKIYSELMLSLPHAEFLRIDLTAEVKKIMRFNNNIIVRKKFVNAFFHKG